MTETPNETIVSPKIQKLDAIVEASLEQNLKSSSSATQNHLSTRGRGRPRKGGAPNKATLERMHAELGVAFGEKSTEPDNPPGPTAPPEFGSPSSAQQAQPQAAPMDVQVPDEVIEVALDLPFAIARSKTKYEKWGLDEETKKELTPMVQTCLKVYFPQMDAKHVPLAMVLFTIGSTFYVQHQQYKAHVAAMASSKFSNTGESTVKTETVAPKPEPAVRQAPVDPGLPHVPMLGQFKTT